MSVKELRKVGEDKVIEIPKKAAFEGKFSKVYFGIFDKKEVAVKRVDADDDLKELDYLRDFQHENIVRYLYMDVHPEGDYIFIVLEKCRCTLREFINEKEHEILHLTILWQVVCGLNYLHSVKNMIHRDLKPPNILMNLKDGQWVAKLSDFGISKKMEPDRTKVTQSQIRGTVGYHAPETLRGEKIDKRADIFALGVIFYYVLSEGDHPFGEDNLKVELLIRDGEVEPNLNNLKQEYADDAPLLILSMLAHDRKNRLHITQVMAHHLFWNGEKKLSFIQEVSDYGISPANFDTLSPKLEVSQSEIVGDWRKKLYDEHATVKKVLEEMRNKRQKNGVFDLLRNIRNLKMHYNEKPQEFRDLIGLMPDGMSDFFTSRFPKLLPFVYDVLKCCKEDFTFKKYYEFSGPAGIDLNRSPSQCESSDTVTTVDPAQRTCPVSNAKAGKETRPSSVPGTGLTQEMKEISFGKIESENKLLVQKDEKELMQQAQEGKSSSIAIPSGSAKIERSSQGSDLASEVDSTSLPTNTDKNKLVLREYQKELAEQALKGENSLIVAPTGSGKTAVLTKVIEDHFSVKGGSRVMFMVPKTALACQQFLYLERHLEGCTVNYMIGQDVGSVPFGQRMLDNQITVLTPQILINELIKDEDQRYLTFKDLSMLIFDECHNATKSHPYRQLMDMLLDFEEVTSKEHPIQVIGVTASPGVGKAKDRTKVKNRLIELLGNLNVMSAPSTVEKNVEELSRHHSKIKESFLQVQTEKVFALKIEKFVSNLERSILKLLQENGASIRKPPPGKASQPYDNWIEDLNEVARSNVQNGENSRLIISYAVYLKFCHYLLQLKDLVPNAIDQARKKVIFLVEGPEYKEMEEKLQELQKDAVDIQTPMFDMLLRIVQDELVKNPQAQCMVFVEWKLTAECLNNSITTRLDGIKSTFLIGTQSSGGTKGMTKNEQNAVVQDFRAGKYNVLIATSIAEAGLDFSDCSLVLMYNYVTGEVGREQRHGRGRAKTSRAIIMTAVGSDLKKREQENMSRIEATKKAIEDIKNSDVDNLKQQILNAQKKHKQERKRKREAVTNLKNVEPPSKWKILCGSCKNLLTTGDRLCHIDNTHTIIKDRDFFDRTEKRMVQKDKAPGVIGKADYHCGKQNCGEKVALGMEYENKLCPALSIKRIVIKNAEGRIQNPKKKKNLPFRIDQNIDEFGEGDLDMYEAIDQSQVREESTDTSLSESDCYEFIEIAS